MTYEWQKEESNKLGIKSCPFCGGQCAIKEIGNEHTKKHCFEIKCTKCITTRMQCVLNRGGHLTFDELKAKMIKDWNTRVEIN